MVVGSRFTLYADFVDNNKGYGVFSSEFIAKGSDVEICYCIPTDKVEWKDYAFGDPQILPLGFGAIYNHSDDFNLIWSHVENNIIKFVSVKDVEIGTELCHNYGELYWKGRRNKKLI